MTHRDFKSRPLSVCRYDRQVSDVLWECEEFVAVRVWSLGEDVLTTVSVEEGQIWYKVTSYLTALSSHYCSASSVAKAILSHLRLIKHGPLCDF